MDTFIDQRNALTKGISELESMRKFTFDFDLSRDVNSKNLKRGNWSSGVVGLIKTVIIRIV